MKKKDKFDKIQFVFFNAFALMCSTMILHSMLTYDWLSIIVVVILGILNFGIEFFISKTFDNEFVFFNRLKEQAHPFVQKIWIFSKNITILLFIQLFGIDFIAAYFTQYTSNQIDTSILLFDCILVVLCFSGVASLLSIGFKSVFDDKFRTIKNKKYDYEVSVPNQWAQEKQDIVSNTILTVTNKINDEWLLLLCDSKAGYSDDAELKDYIDIIKDNLFIDSEDITVESFERLAGRIDAKSILFEMKSLIKKKKYRAIVGFKEGSDKFYHCTIIAPERSYIENLPNYLRIAESLKVR